MSDDLEVNDLSLKGVFVGFKKEKINLVNILNNI